MRLDLEQLRQLFAADERVQLALLFGSAQDGAVRPGSDVDLAVLFDPPLSPVEFFQFYVELSAQLPEIAELDLTDLNHAGTLLAFEALRGRRLFVRNQERVAGFASRVAREYEDDQFYAKQIR